jgi:hypothetical protein
MDKDDDQDKFLAMFRDHSLQNCKQLKETGE